jgi:outer membrane receptor for ferrienterochelin and colicin
MGRWGQPFFLPMALALCWLSLGLGVAQQVPPTTPPPTPAATPPAAADDPFSMDLDSLADVKVTTASKFPESLSDAPSVITVVSRDEIKRFGGMTLSEILGRVAGLTRTSAYFGDSSIIAARGDQSRRDSGHILILINGRPTREVMQGGIDSDILESFPVGIIDRIEVIKGPGSVLYGSDAYSGVINLITQKAQASGFHISSAAGPSATTATSGEAFFTQDSLNIVAAGQYHADPRWAVDYRTATVVGGPVTNRYDTLRNEGDGGYLGLNYKGLSFMSSYTGLESSSFVRGIVGDVRWKRGFFDLGYALKASRKWDMTFNLTYSRNVLDAPDYPSVHRDSHEVIFEWTNFVTFSEKDKLTFGALLNHVAGTETYLGAQPPSIDATGYHATTGVYAQYEHKLTDDLKLIAGFQANKIGSLKLDVVPRAGILWNLTEHVTLKTLYGGAFRAPSLDETELNHPGLKGDPTLSPEKVGTLDVQLGYQGNRLQLSAGYFHSRQTNLIVENAFANPAFYYNLSTPVTYQGVDTEGKYYLNHHWFAMGSVLYQRNNTGVGLPYTTSVPGLGVKAGASYETKNGGELSLFDVYQGHIPGYAASLNQLPSAFHTVSANFRYDLTSRWLKSNSRGIAVFAHADDLLNHQVWLPTLAFGPPNTMPVIRGRTIFVGVEVWQKKE